MFLTGVKQIWVLIFDAAKLQRIYLKEIMKQQNAG